jgi:hypothetical protein
MILIVALIAVFSVAASIGLWCFSRRWQRVWKVLGRTGALALIAISALLILLFSFAGGMCGRYDFPPWHRPMDLARQALTNRIAVPRTPFIVPFSCGSASLARPPYSRLDTTPGCSKFSGTEQIGLLFDIPVTRPVRRSSAVSRNGAMFKSSAFRMRPTTANPLRICRLSRDRGKEREWLGSLA